MSENTDNMKRNLYAIFKYFREIAENKDKDLRKAQKQKIKEWIFEDREAQTLNDMIKFLGLDLSPEDFDNSPDSFCAKLSDALEKINVKRSKKSLMNMADEYSEKYLKSSEPYEPPKEEIKYSPVVSVKKEEKKNDWVIMVVKAEYPPETRKGESLVSAMIEELYEIIERNCKEKSHLKLSHDGIIVAFKPEHGGHKNALKSAQKILRDIEKENLRFERARLQARIGIASGECIEIGKWIDKLLMGETVDFAVRLCEEARPHTILIDNSTKSKSELPPYNFKICEYKQDFYFLQPFLLVEPVVRDYYEEGIWKLYINRKSLAKEMSPIRVIEMAAPGSEILVAGRTLISWTKIGKEMIHIAEKKNIKFKFLVCSPEVMFPNLDEDQKKEVKADFLIARQFFFDLVEKYPDYFYFRQTTLFISDGITCATIHLNGDKPLDKLIVLQDINAAPGGSKPCLLFACICGKESEVCMAHGLYKRTILMFEQANRVCMAHELYKQTSSIFDKANSVKIEIPSELGWLRQGEGLNSRNNLPKNYVPQVIEYLKCIKNGKLKEVPPPCCVQIQISSRCNAECVMCQNWKSESKELSLEKLEEIFRNISDFGVKTIILSGGEPLIREDICDILKSAHDAKLKIGILTNGTLKDSKEIRRVSDAINKCVEWVAVSIDGTEDADRKIRKYNNGRIKLIREFRHHLKTAVSVSATVTLQKYNIYDDFREVCRFINWIGIEQVNFKFATGSHDALTDKPDFLPNRDELRNFISFLWNNPLPNEDGNNLDYLRRCFAGGLFDEDDVIKGSPLLSFYKNQQIRCFAPFIFSLIDSEGRVYPCCHLYRDNHGNDERTKEYRNKHCLGNVTQSSFAEIWNGKEYQEKRKLLKLVNPRLLDYAPCGECTRYFQHNLILSKVYEEFQNDDFERLKEITKDIEVKEAVWF